mgnify:CR=1 FL=1
MSITVPAFSLVTAPTEWDDLTLMAAVDFLEAEGEPDDGKLGVVWVVVNRADRWQQTFKEVLLKPGQFSCLNADYFPTMGYARLAAAGISAEACWRAAASGLWRLRPDPTGGADHYLRLDATKAARKRHDLPTWAADPSDPTQVNQSKVTAVIGHHHFLRLG